MWDTTCVGNCPNRPYSEVINPAFPSLKLVIEKFNTSNSSLTSFLNFNSIHIKRCQLLLELKLDKISQMGDQRIYLMVFFDNRAQIICFFLLFLLFLNNIKISTLDAKKVIKNYFKSVQFSGYFFGNLWNSMIIITNFFSCYFIISTKFFII